MKHPRRSRRLSLVLGHWAFVLSSLAALAANDDALRPIAFQNGINQQTLGAETAELARAIDDLIDELERNGFPVQSLAGLSELAAQLNALGGTEMTSIARRLRRLGENAQTDPRATAAEAYQAQQAIESRLKALARQISIQQLRVETARRLEALIARQIDVQRETRAIAAPGAANDERQQLLESDQSGIGVDLSSFFQTGDTLLSRLRETDTPASASAPAAGTPAPAAPTFSERINGDYLNTLSTEALDHLKAKRYPEAFARQGALIIELRKILQGIRSSLPKEQRLANALQEVSALRQQEEARAKTDTDSKESNQEAADQAQSLADQVAALSPEAAAALREAKEAFEDAEKASEERNDSEQQAKNESPQDQSDPQQNQQAGNEQQQDQSNEQQASNQQSPSSQDQANSQQNQPGGDDQQQDQSNEQQASNQQSPSSQDQANSQQNQQGGDDQQGKPGEQQASNQQPPGSSEQQQNQNGKGEQSDEPGKSAAAQALAAAEAALQAALAQAQSQASNGKSPGQQQNQPGQQQGQGEQQARMQQGKGQQQSGEGQQQQAGKGKGEQQGEGPTQLSMDGSSPDPNQRSGGLGTYGSKVTGHGPTNTGPAQVIGALRQEEREAFTALQGERYPAEYSAWVQQYWRNLAQEQ